MKHNNFIKIITLFTIFAVGSSVAFVSANKKEPVEVNAEQYVNNFDSYTYSGSYYSSFNFNAQEGLNNALRQNLTSLIHPKGWYTYSGAGADELGSILQYADQDPTNSSNMIYLYTRDSVKKNGAVSWNREHCWPQSLSNDCWGTSKGGGSDLLHIRPTYQSSNSTRGNCLYGEVTNGTEKSYNGMFYGYLGGGYFEPLDSVKGDVARIIMYTWVAYKNHYTNLPDVTNVFRDYDTLLTWHTQDRPDVMEGNRNDYSETSIQLNRNPFVDHPELAWKIFGNSASSSVKSACVEAYPADGSATPINPTGISLNKTTLSLSVGNQYTLVASLTPSGATGTITWSSNNTSVASVSSTGKVTANSAGTAIINAHVGSYSATCIVTVSSSGGTATGSLELASSISVGDTVYLTANDSNKQYVGPSSSSTVYGVGEEFTGEPDSSKCALEVQDGNSSNTYAFKIKEGTNANKYLSWSSGNSLAVASSITANSSWRVSFSSNNVATISNASDNTRVIWWNVGSPRFACYTGKTAGSSYHATQLWKLVSSSSSTGPDEYLKDLTTYATIHGREAETNISNIDFSEQGYENGEKITTVAIDSNITLVCNKNSGSTAPAYYNTGESLRIYGGNTMTLSATNGTISKIEFTIASGSVSSFNLSSGSFTGDIWNGGANSVVFTNKDSSGHVRVAEIKITCSQGTASVDNVAIRFGASISQVNWNNIKNHDGWTIADYGVMMLKKATLQGYGKSSIAQAYKDGKAVSVVNKTKNGAAYSDPYLTSSIYSFTAKLTFANVADYDELIVAAPFVVVSSEYYFLNEVEFSVNTLASYYLNNPTYMGGSNLSNVALTYLSTAH
jgi:endonuclease I